MRLTTDLFLAALLALPLGSFAAQPKVTVFRAPSVNQVVPLPTLQLSLLPTSEALRVQAVAPLRQQTVPVLAPAPALVPASAAPEAGANPLFAITPQTIGSIPLSQPSADEGLEESARTSALRFDGLSGPSSNDNGYAMPQPLAQKISRRVNELMAKYQHEKSATASGSAHDNTGLGHAAEIMVLRSQAPNLINVSEEVTRDGEVVGEIDAETATHLIEIASGRLDSGKKNKVQQMTRFLRAEAKRRGKDILFYINPDRADAETMDRLKKIGAKAGIKVEFLPIPWDQRLLEAGPLN